MVTPQSSGPLCPVPHAPQLSSHRCGYLCLPSHQPGSDPSPELLPEALLCPPVSPSVLYSTPAPQELWGSPRPNRLGATLLFLRGNCSKNRKNSPAAWLWLSVKL